MTYTKILICCLGMCLLSSATVYWLLSKQDKKIAVVDAVKLFDQFNLKKELEAQDKTKLLALSKQVDSVANQLRLVQAGKNEDEMKKVAFAYNNIKQSLEESYTQSNKDINQQVWKRLNIILDQFGKYKKLHLILGANGMGSILYNDDYYDLTGEAINYANKRYEEGN